MIPLEKSVEQTIRRYAKQRNVLFLKFVSPGNAGVPDRVLIGDSVIAFLEIKRPGESPRPLQRSWLDRLRLRKAWIGWVDSTWAGCQAVEAVALGSREMWEKAVKG